jgi:hypothetical protein
MNQRFGGIELLPAGFPELVREGWQSDHFDPGLGGAVIMGEGSSHSFELNGQTP